MAGLLEYLGFDPARVGRGVAAGGAIATGSLLTIGEAEARVFGERGASNFVLAVAINEDEDNPLAEYEEGQVIVYYLPSKAERVFLRLKSGSGALSFGARLMTAPNGEVEEAGTGKPAIAVLWQSVEASASATSSPLVLAVII